jgi:hypothetical protein
MLMPRGRQTWTLAALSKPLLFFGPPSSRGLFFARKYVFTTINPRSRREKSDKVSLFSRKWQYYRIVERLVSVKALIKDGFPREPLLASPPSFKAGAFLFPR